MFFTFFKLYKWYQIAQSVTYVDLKKSKSNKICMHTCYVLCFYVTGVTKKIQTNLAVIQMFSSNAMEIFLKLYEKVATLLLIARRQKEPLMSPQCFALLSIIPHLLKLTHMLLIHLLETTFSFKDNRLIQKLLLLHKTLCSKPPAGYLASLLTKIQEDIVNLLLKYMKGTTTAPDSETGKFNPKNDHLSILGMKVFMLLVFRIYMVYFIQIRERAMKVIMNTSCA